MSIEAHLESLVGDLPHGLSEGIALGTGLAEGYDVYESAIGAVIVTFNIRGVSSVDIAERFEVHYPERFHRPLFQATAPHEWRDLIPVAIERGTPGRLPVDLRSLTEFQRQVLETTATIPRGQVRPYGWVAREIDRPRAVRAVGTALAHNPVPLIIPCHRVVRSDGQIGNYSLGGPHIKAELLELRHALTLRVVQTSITRNLVFDARSLGTDDGQLVHRRVEDLFERFQKAHDEERKQALKDAAERGAGRARDEQLAREGKEASQTQRPGDSGAGDVQMTFGIGGKRSLDAAKQALSQGQLAQTQQNQTGGLRRLADAVRPAGDSVDAPAEGAGVEDAGCLFWHGTSGWHGQVFLPVSCLCPQRQQEDLSVPPQVVAAAIIGLLWP